MSEFLAKESPLLQDGEGVKRVSDLKKSKAKLKPAQHT
jgi:hypothetical protein